MGLILLEDVALDQGQILHRKEAVRQIKVLYIRVPSAVGYVISESTCRCNRAPKAVNPTLMPGTNYGFNQTPTDPVQGVKYPETENL